MRPRPTGLADRLRGWARVLRREALVVHYAARDPDTPMAARLLALAVAAYALSPIDLIPDFIPVLGLLDDIVLVPLGIALVLRLLPPAVLHRARTRAEAAAARPVSRAMGLLVVLVWAAAGLLLAAWAYRLWQVRAG